MATAPDSAAQELRRAMYGGIIASVFATCGWLTWLFGRALSEDWTAIFGPLVGAGLGVLVHAVEHYHEVAHFERHGGEWDERETKIEENPPPRRFGAGLVRSVIPLVLAFVALTCEHVLGELLHEYLAPLAESVAILFPAGAMFALAFNRKPESGSFLEFVARGAVTGVLAALAAALVQWAMLGEVGWGGLFGWWVLLGVGLSLVSSHQALGPFRAMGGVVVALGCVVFCSLPGPFDLLSKVPIPVVRGPLFALGAAVGGALGSPDLPAHEWMLAEEKEAARAAKERELKGLAPLSEREGEWEPGRRLADAMGYKGPRVKMFEAFDPAALARAEKVFSQNLDEASMGFTENRRDRLGHELVRGWNSALIRSWIVMLLFCFGLGLAPFVEAELRPDDYPSTRTAHNDRVMAALVFGLLALVCLGFRMYPSFAH